MYNGVTGCIFTTSFKDFKFPRASKFKTIKKNIGKPFKGKTVLD